MYMLKQLELNLVTLEHQWNVINGMKDDTKRKAHLAKIEKWIEQVNESIDNVKKKLSKAS